MAESTSGLPYKWRVLIAVVFGLFMVILDATVVNVAFRTLQEEFAANVNDSQWVISVYVMALGISTPLSGFLADRFGAKRIFVGGLAVFTIGSVACGLSQNLWFLIAARGLQGAGGGLALPLGTALLFNAFRPEERGKALGIFGISLVVAPALGPILGGWLVDHGHWRWIFFLNLPIGALGVTLGSLWLRAEPGTRRPAFDPLGLVTSTVGFGSVLYAASIAADKGWGSPQVIAGFVIGGVTLVAFALIELFVAREPLLNLRLFGKPVFTLATLVGWVSVVALFGAEFLLPLYLQILRGRSALEAGVILLPIALTAGVFTPLAGQLYDKVGARPLLVIGFGLLAINTWQLGELQANTSIRWILFLLALRGAALGMTIQTTLVTALSVVPPQLTARGSALSNATRQVVQSIGVAVLATVLAATLSPGLSAQLEAFQKQAPTAAAGTRVELCALPPGVAPPQVYGLVQQFCGEYIQGLHNAYRLTFYAALLAMLLGATLPGWPLRWAGRQEQARGAPAMAGH
jgi:EmrB/QacA subfamily drug resistance transporter